MFTNFSLLSGLRVNIDKSWVFYSSGIPRRKIDKLTSISTIRSTPSLGKYLSFPILTGRPKKANFDFTIERMQTRLASCKGKLLNKVGRMTLAKSALSSIPAYYMQLALLPNSICQQLDRITRDFVWKWTLDRGLQWVIWDKVAQPKKNGGLGFRKTRENNTAFLGKLVWEMHHKSPKLWVFMLHSEHVGTTSFLDMPHKYGSSVWNSMLRARNALREGYRFRLGDGKSPFWFTNWTQFGPLCEQCFRLLCMILTLESMTYILIINGSGTVCILKFLILSNNLSLTLFLFSTVTPLTV